MTPLTADTCPSVVPERMQPPGSQYHHHKGDSHVK
jgi:hypothetical protein